VIRKLVDDLRWTLRSFFDPRGAEAEVRAAVRAGKL
jgi:hypothetical protein